MRAKFGPAGNSDSFSKAYKSSLKAPAWIAAQGLDCYEYQCGKGVHIGEEAAVKLGQEAVKAGISLSLHAPYFINLANPDPESLKKTIGYITQACFAAQCMGAGRVVIHSGALMKRTRREAQEIALKSMKEVITACDDAGYENIALCPETMGKINQLGDLNEVLQLCLVDERFIPCIDFGHLNARTVGRVNSFEDVGKVFEAMENTLGTDRMRAFHSHFSKIEYTAGGEKQHLTFEDAVFGPQYEPLLDLLYERSLAPVIICESAGTQSEDAAAMSRYYAAL